MRVQLVDESGIGAGASGMSGGLLHPFSPKGILRCQPAARPACSVD